jgi:hypothetical protein
MKKEQRLMKEIRGHLSAVANIIGEDDPELFTEPRLRSAASQAAELHRVLERLIGRVEVQNELARNATNRIGGADDPMKYVAGA